MVRPCVARGFVELASAVLHQCIRPLIGACAPGHHGYQRACVLISGQASSGPFGSPVFACAGKRPNIYCRVRPSTAMIWNLAYLIPISLAFWYSGELNQSWICSMLSLIDDHEHVFRLCPFDTH